MATGCRAESGGNSQTRGRARGHGDQWIEAASAAAAWAPIESSTCRRLGALVGTRLREGGHCACASFAWSTTEITRSSCGRVELKPGLQYTRACLQYTRRTTSHHAAPWRAVLRSTVRINSHRFAPIEQCSIFCARPSDFAAARLRLQAKLGLFNVLGQKGLSKTLVQTNGFCYPSSSSFFCTLFVVFLVKTALLFFK